VRGRPPVCFQWCDGAIGSQEETTVLGIPCITMREKTEPAFVGLYIHKETTVIARAPTERWRAVSAPWRVLISPVMASVNRCAPIRRRQNQEITRIDRCDSADARLDGRLESPPRAIRLAHEHRTYMARTAGLPCAKYAGPFARSRSNSPTTVNSRSPDCCSRFECYCL
jgi:hypothetical protein